MKAALAISGVAHAAILLWGAFFHQSARTHEAALAEALPIDFVPIESITRSVAGDSRANRTEKPLPRPANPPDEKPAKNIGNAKADIKSSPEALKKPVGAKANMPPQQSKKPKPKPATTKLKLREKTNETPVSTTEIASLNEPAAPVAEIKSRETPAKAEESDNPLKLPDKAPLPISRPRPQKSKIARTTQRKRDSEASQRQKLSAREKEKLTDDKIAALLNRQDTAAAGAKRSTSPEALGARNPNDAKKLSRSEMDALRSAIQQCWNVPIGLSDAENMRVTVTMNLARDGSVRGQVGVDARGGESVRARRTFAESARRAVLKCAPYNLPNDKYDVWSEVIVNFDPRQMF